MDGGHTGNAGAISSAKSQCREASRDGGHAGNVGTIPVRHEHAPLKYLREHTALVKTLII